MYGEFGECDALSSVCIMDLYEQRWEHERHLPVFPLIFDSSDFRGCFFSPLARWFACHANIWPFAASVASTWAFRFGMVRGGVDMRKIWNAGIVENMVGNVGFI